MAHWLFRANASRQEKIYTVAMGCWVWGLLVGYMYYSSTGFELTAGAIYAFLPVSLLLAFAIWWPIYKDRHPSNPTLTYSPRKRISRHIGLYLVALLMVWMTFSGVIGPFLTISYGTPISSEFLVIDRSGGHPKRGCNYDVWLRDRQTGGIVKVCLGKQRWETVSEGQILIGSGKQSALGHTIELLSPRES
ncbi:hypothetical protein ACFPN2_09285 [Steroidobacter flavus]|uniref:Uncharacterized protein n=1 Tax=Steroidobacter flavus TaxID=1842136 RepID=A0ABV8SNR4_9GAMM